MTPVKRCECGCGEEIPALRGTRPRRFAHNHHRRKSPVEYVIDDATGCWLWQRSIVDGYGTVGVGARRVVKAHRWYYETAVGPIPEGAELHHTCRVRRCVNPEHLEPVTRLEHRRLHPRSKVAA